MSTTPTPFEEKALPPVPESPSAAAVQFSQAFQEMERAIKKGFNKLDPASQTSHDELYATMRSTPPKPATVINLHPWPLVIDGPRLLKGILIPPCPAGARFQHHHIRGWRKDWEYTEDGTLKFKAVLPIKLAGEFVLAFSNNEFSNKNGCNGGVIIYEGEGHPDKAGLVETYGPTGRVITRDEPGWDFDPEENKIPVINQVPVKRELSEILKEAIAARNAYYFKRVQAADSDYRDEKKRPFLSLEQPRLMAEVLHAEGLLPSVPVWNLATRMQQGLADDNCPSCGAPRKVDAIACSECKYALEPVECYANGIITWDQLEMHNLSTEEWEQAFEIRDQKDTAKQEAMARRAQRTAAPASQPDVDPKGSKADKGQKSDKK